MNKPPLILAGADTVNAISIVRSLARTGVDVRLLCWRGALPARSRYARRLPIEGGRKAWADYLLGPASEQLRGAVLLACNDDAIELLLEHREALRERYVLDVCDPVAQRAMLDKLATYRQATEAGVPTPRYWPVESPDDVLAHEGEYSFPLMLKPLFAHQFKRVFGGKYLLADNMTELVDKYERISRQGLDVVLMEVIPGPDDRLCSYYTYIDEQGQALFHFTKRIIRRFPEHEGFGSYHVTDWNPEVKELGLRLFHHVGLRGVANVEFKRDSRDGILKLIECNARFTAANGLLTASGCDLGLFVYNRLAGLPLPLLNGYELDKRLWNPVADFRAYRQLRRQGALTFPAWVRTVAHRQVFPYFAADDLLPSIVLWGRVVRTLTAETVRELGKG